MEKEKVLSLSLMLSLLFILSMSLTGCAKDRGSPGIDPARTVMGLASEKVHREVLESPVVMAKYHPPLSQKYQMDFSWQGPAGEALAVLAKMLGYEARIENRDLSSLTLMIGSGQARILELVSHLNRQLKPLGGEMGIDSFNMVLTLKSSN